jgi:hypothetical protein
MPNSAKGGYPVKGFTHFCLASNFALSVSVWLSSGSVTVPLGAQRKWRTASKQVTVNTTTEQQQLISIYIRFLSITERPVC